MFKNTPGLIEPVKTYVKKLTNLLHKESTEKELFNTLDDHIKSNGIILDSNELLKDLKLDRR